MQGLRSVLSQHRPADSVTVVFLLFLLSLTMLYFRQVPKAPLLIVLYSALIAAQLAMIRFRERNRFLGVFSLIVFPILCVLLIFDSLGHLVHDINPDDIDPLLIKADYLIFQGHPTVMLESIAHPLLTDLLQLAYTSYYFIPIGFCILLFARNQREEFDRSVFLILLCFYLSYVGYLLFPALGPRFALSELQTTELQGLLVAGPIQDLLNRLEGIKRDAFPSGHTAITVLVLVLAYRNNRNFFWIALPVVSALILATVYCRYHYVVDVIAGLALTLITLVLGKVYYDWWERVRPSGRDHLT